MKATDQQSREMESLIKASNIELDYMTAKLRNLLGQSERGQGSMSPPLKNDRYQSSEVKDTWTSDRFKRAMDTLLASGFGAEQKKKELEYSATQKNFKTAAQLSNHSNISRPLANAYGFKDLTKLNSFTRQTNYEFQSRPVASSFRRVEEAYLNRFIPPQIETKQNTRSLCPSPSNQSKYHVPQAFKQRHKSSSNHSVRPSDNTKTRETIMIIPYQLKEMKQDFKSLIWNKENEVKANNRTSKTKAGLSNDPLFDQNPSKVLRSGSQKPNMKSTRDMDKFFVLMKKEEKHKDTSKSRPVSKKTCQKISKCVDSKTLQQALKDYFGLPVK